MANYEVSIFTIYGNGILENELYSEVKVQSLYSNSYQELSKLQKRMVPFKMLMRRNVIYNKHIKGKYDVEISFLEGPITRIFCTKNKAVKKIAWIHNDISKVFGKGIKAWFKKKMDQSIYPKYQQLVFVSQENLNRFNQVYKEMPMPHETVIYNYINPNRIKEKAEKTFISPYSNNEISILTVTRLVEQKAIDRLIKVHAKLIQAKVKHHIYVIGEGPEREKLEQLIKELKVENTFTLLGAKENPYPYIKNADFFCLLSNFEGYGMVLEEAKILGKYVILTDTAAREAVLDYGEYSKIVDNTEQGIIDGLEECIRNRKELLGKEIFYQYKESKILEKIEKIVGEEN